MNIVKIPSSLGALDRVEGLVKGPDLIVESLKDIWLNEDLKKINFNIDEIKLDFDIKKDIENIHKSIKKFIGHRNIFLGGDHSITYPCFKAFSENFSNPGIIVFDAHPDVYREFNFVTHQDWLYYLVSNRILSASNIIILGLRNPHHKEINYLKENNIKFFTARQIFNNLEYTADTIMEFSRSFDGLYLSIDIDVVDPAFAPGTGYIEPGGLSSRELLYFIQRLKMTKNLANIDIVEVNPKYDLNNMTSKLAAKIVSEFC